MGLTLGGGVALSPCQMHVGLLRHQVELLSRELENRARRERETQQCAASRAAPRLSRKRRS